MNDKLLMLDSLDDAVIGACMTWHGDMLVERVVYDGNKLASILKTRDNMSEEEAQEFIDFNIIGAYVGEATPIVMWPATAEELNANS